MESKLIIAEELTQVHYELTQEYSNYCIDNDPNDSKAKELLNNVKELETLAEKYLKLRWNRISLRFT